ncbi:MAG: adenine deaminase [Fusobacteriaceae bacterium]
MKRFRKIDRIKIINAAMGRIPFDLVIKNANIVNVFTGEIYVGEIGISDKHIAYVKGEPENLNRDKKEMWGEKTYDAKGNFVLPGLIDAHVHIESSMMTPRRFAEVVIPTGTTTVITDPHEIANVFGVEGVKYMHEASEGINQRHIILAPSCVPAVENMDSNGAEFLTAELEELLKQERTIGLGEIMDYPGILNCSKRMMDILEAGDNKGILLQGHAPTLNTRDLAAYLCSGPNTDHETTTAQEAKDKLRNGMYVDSREGSICKDVKAIYEGIKNFKYLDRVTLCTDDREIGDVLEHGHMNDVVRAAIAYGMDPLDAIRAATINTAREIGYRDIGGIAPGFLADILIVDTLESMNPLGVFFEGKLVAENGKLIEEIPNKKFIIESKDSVDIADLNVETFKIKAPIKNGKLSTNLIVFSDKEPIITKLMSEELKIENGYLDISERPDLKYIAVVNRYGKYENIALGVLKDFGLTKGAIAGTVAHDSHNLIIVYSTPEEAVLAAETIKKMKGGICSVLKEDVLEILNLEVAGLMSDRAAKDIEINIERLKESYGKLGLDTVTNPLLKTVFLSLPVIPEVRITDCGIVHCSTQKFIPIFNV